ncbi:5-hydroxytryptamine receptor 2B-like [Littorina saxatilis]|uniref:5-hydroxytryptamine receptor 2B-like n=1 Tax=Littorina saxatilis TaxID=31220 RepID=UPI0038B599A6
MSLSGDWFSSWTAVLEVSLSKSSAYCLATDESLIDEYRSCLSEVSFRNRLPLTVYLSVVAVVGFIGNALVMIVYWQSFKPSANRIFVLAMAIEDMTVNVIALPLQIITIRYAYNTYSYWLCRGLFAAAAFPTQTLGLIHVAVALDRFSRIWWPQKKHITAHQCCVINIVIFFFAHVLFVGFVPMYGIHSYPSHIAGVSVKMCWYDDEYYGTPYPRAHAHVVNVIVFGGMVLMTTSYILIGIKVWKRKTPMKESIPLTAKSFQICSPEYPFHSKHAGEATVIDEPQENSESMSTRGGADVQTASGSAQNITVVEVSAVPYPLKSAMSTIKATWRKNKVSYEEEHPSEMTLYCTFGGSQSIAIDRKSRHNCTITSSGHRRKRYSTRVITCSWQLL